MRRLAATGAVLLAAAAGSSRAPAQPPPTSARTAEQRVLASPRLFWRWGGVARSFVDPETRLLRTGTRATCRPQARRAARVSFLCLVSRGGGARLRVRYLGYGPGAFRLLRR